MRIGFCWRSTFIKFGTLSALLLGTVESRSQITTTLSETAAVNTVVNYVISPATGGYGFQNNKTTPNNNVRSVAQSFRVPTSFNLDQITLQLNGNVQRGVPDAKFSIRIYQVQSASTAPSSDSLINTQIGKFSGFKAGTGAGQYLTFTLPAPVPLAAGKFYVFSLSFTGPPEPNENLPFDVTSPGKYTDGEIFCSDDGVTYTPTGFDFNFSLGSSSISKLSSATITIPVAHLRNVRLFARHSHMISKWPSI